MSQRKDVGHWVSGWDSGIKRAILQANKVARHFERIDYSTAPDGAEIQGKSAALAMREFSKELRGLLFGKKP